MAALCVIAYGWPGSMSNLRNEMTRKRELNQLPLCGDHFLGHGSVWVESASRSPLAKIGVGVGLIGKIHDDADIGIALLHHGLNRR
jgi:hypothetical protein